MGTILKTAAGVVIGILLVNIMFLKGLPSRERNMSEQMEAHNELRIRATVFRTAVHTYFNEHRILPRYWSDMTCRYGASTYPKCATGRSGGIFYLGHENEWIALEPTRAGERVEFGCQSTIADEIRFDPSFADCGDLDRAAIPPFSKPSFDCSAATRVVEKLICTSDRLIESDLQLAATYAGIRSRASESRQLEIERDQLEFLRHRDQRCTDIDCIDRLTRERVFELEGL